MKTFLNIAAASTAIGLVAFSGSISAYGLSKFAPGAELAIIVMAVLFESAKLLGFAMVHRPAPRTLKGALLSVGLLLMLLNIVGVAGFLSNAYTSSQISARAAAHATTAGAHAEVSLLEQQLAEAGAAVSEARGALIKARANKARAAAAQAILTATTAEHDRLVTKLSAANTTTAQVEGDTIQAGGEFASVVFLAEMFGTDQDTVAHILIAVIASLPDILAALLMITIGYTAPKAKTSESTTPVESTAKGTTAAQKPRQRSKAAKKAWTTRRRKALVAAQQRGLAIVK
jgi:hypothetical protein